MLVFAKIFENLNSKVHIFFDKDIDTRNQDIIINPLLSSYNHYMFTKTLEEELGYIDSKSDTVKFIEFLEGFNFNGSNYL